MTPLVLVAPPKVMRAGLAGCAPSSAGVPVVAGAGVVRTATSRATRMRASVIASRKVLWTPVAWTLTGMSQDVRSFFVLGFGNTRCARSATNRRCRPGMVAESRASGRNSTTRTPVQRPPGSFGGCPGPDAVHCGKRRQALGLALPHGLGRDQVRCEPAIPVPEWQLFCERYCAACQPRQIPPAPYHCISQAHRRPEGARSDRIAPCRCDAPTTRITRERSLVMAPRRLVTLSSSAGAQRVSGTIRPADADHR
jgi:hypothetical protein